MGDLNSCLVEIVDPVIAAKKRLNNFFCCGHLLKKPNIKNICIDNNRVFHWSPEIFLTEFFSLLQEKKQFPPMLRNVTRKGPNIKSVRDKGQYIPGGGGVRKTKPA